MNKKDIERLNWIFGIPAAIVHPLVWATGILENVAILLLFIVYEAAIFRRVDFEIHRRALYFLIGFNSMVVAFVPVSFVVNQEIARIWMLLAVVVIVLALSFIWKTNDVK